MMLMDMTIHDRNMERENATQTERANEAETKVKRLCFELKRATTLLERCRHVNGLPYELYADIQEVLN